MWGKSMKELSSIHWFQNAEGDEEGLVQAVTLKNIPIVTYFSHIDTAFNFLSFSSKHHKLGSKFLTLARVVEALPIQVLTLCSDY